MDVFRYNTHNQGHCSDTCLFLFQCCFLMFFFGALPKFEANIERNREKEVQHKKHNMSTSFLQLTQVLINNVTDYSCATKETNHNN